MFHSKIAGIFRPVFYLHTKLQMPSSNCSLAVSVKPKARYGFLTEAVLLLYVIEKYYFKESCVLFEELYCIKYQDSTFSSANTIVT
jgi:hypothetical protein